MSVNDRWLEILLAPARDGVPVSEVCRRYGISRQSFYEYRRRLWAEGIAGLQPRSRCPANSPRKTTSEVESLIVRLRVDNPRWGARVLRTKLQQAGLDPVPAVSTVHRVLVRHSLVHPHRTRAPKAWKRFERQAPNDLWQIDGTQVALTDGSKAWIIDLIDDHARYAIGAHAVRRFTAQAAWTVMEKAVTEHGAPRQLISDNGLQFHSRKGHKPVFFQERLTALGVKQLHSRPRHPQTCGKLERYHRTFKEYYADHGPAKTIEELQNLCDRFRWYYNQQRPHLSLNQETPAAVYTLSKKATPEDNHRVRTAPRVLKVSTAGSVNYRKRKINIGQAHTGAHVRIIEGPDHITVYLVATGEILRQLTLGPVGTYHGSGSTRGRPRKPPTTN